MVSLPISRVYGELLLCVTYSVYSPAEVISIMAFTERPCPMVFSVTPFKLDQNKNQHRSIDEDQNLGKERRYIYKDPRQDSGQGNISYTRYPKKCFTQI